MYPYKFPSGKTMYFPTRLKDIEEHEGGKLGINDLLKRSRFLGEGIAPEEQVLEIEGTVLAPKRINFTAH